MHVIFLKLRRIRLRDYGYKMLRFMYQKKLSKSTNLRHLGVILVQLSHMMVCHKLR